MEWALIAVSAVAVGLAAWRYWQSKPWRRRAGRLWRSRECYRQGRFWVADRRRYIVCEDAPGVTWVCGEYWTRLEAVRVCEALARAGSRRRYDGA